MELRVVNPTFTSTNIIDDIESILFTERYDRPGDFELYSRYTPELFDILKKDYYIITPDSDHIMIIENREIKSNPETGPKIIVSGRSFESVLDRRIILKQILIDGSLQGGVHTILNQNVVNGEFPQRNIPNFVLATSSDPIITALTMTAQLYTENVLDAIVAICNQSSIGFRVSLNSNNNFEFILYAGANRSYSQSVNPFVVFSPEFDNLINSQYYESKSGKRNWAFIAGDEGLAFWNQGYYGRWAQIDTFDYDGGGGLSLREVFVDAKSLPTMDYGTSQPLNELLYIAQLEELGYQNLSEKKEIETFSAELDITKQYKYKSDFFLGDIVQYKDDYGFSTSARIVEVTTSENLNGRNVYPTLRSY